MVALETQTLHPEIQNPVSSLIFSYLRARRVLVRERVASHQKMLPTPESYTTFYLCSSYDLFNYLQKHPIAITPAAEFDTFVEEDRQHD